MARRSARGSEAGGEWLALGGLPWWAMLFVALVVQAPAGDRRNWEAIRGWASGLPALLVGEEETADFAEFAD